MKILHHSFCYLFAGRAMGELVGRGEQKPLEILGAWREIRNQSRVLRGRQKIFLAANTLVIQLGGNVEHRPAFGDGDGVNKNPALRDLPKNLARGYRMVEIIFASLERCANVPQTEKFESQPVPNHIIVAKNSSDVPPRSSMWNINEHFFRALATIRATDLRIHQAGASADRRNNQKSQKAESPHLRLFLPQDGRAFLIQVLAQQNGGGDGVHRSLAGARR